MSRNAPVLMVQGTASSVGKSALVAGLCRLFANEGLRVAPFKAQNMSNNAAVCADGGEIGRAQFAQAIAARTEPTVDMNPILLKPQADSAAQVVVRGRVVGTHSAADYFRNSRTDLWPVVESALASLRANYDLVVVEGAGSPAEINLRSRDIVNMRVALHTHADVLLVADIDRGGAFAALLGTWQWLDDAERALVRGFILNKFRGEASLLKPAPELLEARTGVPVVGVVPYLADLGLPEEDAASLSQTRVAAPLVDVAVVQLPHIANFDEFGPLGREAGVALRYVSDPNELRAPDLVILPGTKATIPDLQWLHARGLADRIRWLAMHGTPIFGVCGGYQMLGERVSDPFGLESAVAECRGIGLLGLGTELRREKQLTRVTGKFRDNLSGVFDALSGVPVAGYEIHMGRTLSPNNALITLADGSPDGAVDSAGNVAGTYLHGIFEASPPRHALVRALAARRGFTWSPNAASNDPYDRLAETLAQTLDLSRTCIAGLLAGGVRAAQAASTVSGSDIASCATSSPNPSESRIGRR
jgi:adenosylcobyric acid synthase